MCLKDTSCVLCFVLPVVFALLAPWKCSFDRMGSTSRVARHHFHDAGRLQPCKQSTRQWRWYGQCTLYAGPRATRRALHRAAVLSDSPSTPVRFSREACEMQDCVQYFRSSQTFDIDIGGGRCGRIAADLRNTVLATIRMNKTNSVCLACAAPDLSGAVEGTLVGMSGMSLGERTGVAPDREVSLVALLEVRLVEYAPTRPSSGPKRKARLIAEVRADKTKLETEKVKLKKMYEAWLAEGGSRDTRGEASGGTR